MFVYLPTETEMPTVIRSEWEQGPSEKNWPGPGTIATPMQSLTNNHGHK